MRRFTKASLLASVLLAGLGASPALYGAQAQDSSDSVMGRGMMGHGMMNHRDQHRSGEMMGMMNQMSRMMDQCDNMMSNNRPNDQEQNN